MKALIFPGQGSQKKGMMTDLLEVPEALEILKQAEDLASFSLKEVIQDDPREELNQTKFTQPAIFTVSAMYLAKLQAEEIDYKAVAGHSLGEYSALYASGAMDFSEAMKLVLRRGELMNQVNDPNLGMGAVIGGEVEQVESVVSQVENLYIANLNCPGQTVVSGTKDALSKAEPLFKEAGIRRVIPLKVSGAFHSPFMNPVKEAFGEYLQNCELMDAEKDFYPNIKASVVKDKETIRQCLLDQMTGQVRWTETINTMKAAGINEMIECGPGKVLSGLVKKIDSELNCVNL